jgi:hypothetical protein
MGLFNIFKTKNPDGSLTPAAAIERRLASRRGGLAEAVAERNALLATNADLLARINGIDAHCDIAPAEDIPQLRDEQALLRAERDPIATRLAELDKGIPVREQLITEDERELAVAEYDEKVAQQNTWLAAEREEAKVFEDALLRVCESIRKRASWQALLEAGQQELSQEGRELGRQGGWSWWSAPAIFADAREALAQAYNRGLNERLQVIRTPDPEQPRATAEDIVSALHVPEKEGVWSSSQKDPSGIHTWESAPLAADGPQTCRYRDGCSEPAIATLSYTSPQRGHKAWSACTKHVAEFERQYRQQPRPAGVA